MSRLLPVLTHRVPFGWHVVDIWTEEAVVGTTRAIVAQQADDYLTELQLVREDPLRLVVTSAHVRALGKRIPVWVVAVIARDDEPPVDFPEPAE